MTTTACPTRQAERVRAASGHHLSAALSEAHGLQTMRRLETDVIESVAERYRATWDSSASKTGALLRIGSRRIAVEVVASRVAAEPRLRFDRTAVGLIDRLRAALCKSVPEGQRVAVSITAPIRQDSKTAAILIDRIGGLLSSGGSRRNYNIHHNRIQVRTIQGGCDAMPRVIGFVHNPRPNPEILFDLTRTLLAYTDPHRYSPVTERWLVVANQDGLAPIRTVERVCSELHVTTAIKRILVAESRGFRALEIGERGRRGLR
jgi:hypothetical protein